MYLYTRPPTFFGTNHTLINTNVLFHTYIHSCINTYIYAYTYYTYIYTYMHSYMMMMMILCPKAGSLAFTPPGDEMSEVVSCCLPHRQLRMSYLSKVPTQWLEVDFEPTTLRLQSTEHTLTGLHHRIPFIH